MKSLLIYFTDLDRPCQAFFLLVHQVGIRRPHRPLAAGRSPPRVTLGSWQRPWLVVRGSWLVKTYHYTRMGCGRISQRAAQGSLYRGADRQRRSERLKIGPYAQGRWPCIFSQSVTSFSPIACMRYRRGRPEPFWSARYRLSGGAGRLPERTAVAGVPP